MSHYAFDVNLIEIINSATTDPLGSDTLIQLEKVCKEFLQFIIYKNNFNYTVFNIILDKMISDVHMLHSWA